jgi:hypothetical protein
LCEARHLAEVGLLVVLEGFEASPQQQHSSHHSLPGISCFAASSRILLLVLLLCIGVSRSADRSSGVKLVGQHPHALNALREPHQELKARRAVLLHPLKRRPLGRVIQPLFCRRCCRLLLVQHAGPSSVCVLVRAGQDVPLVVPGPLFIGRRRGCCSPAVTIPTVIPATTTGGSSSSSMVDVHPLLNLKQLNLCWEKKKEKRKKKMVQSRERQI